MTRRQHIFRQHRIPLRLLSCPQVLTIGSNPGPTLRIGLKTKKLGGPTTAKPQLRTAVILSAKSRVPSLSSGTNPREYSCSVWDVCRNQNHLTRCGAGAVFGR